MRARLGGHGKTIIAYVPAVGVEGDKLHLQQRDAGLHLGILEIQAIMAFGTALGLKPQSDTVQVMKNTLQEYDKGELKCQTQSKT